jgi:hypothetical protein
VSRGGADLAVTNNPDTSSPIATLALPAGTYLAFAQGDLSDQAGSETRVGCLIADYTDGRSVFSAIGTLVPARDSGPSGGGFTFVTFHAAFTLVSPRTVDLRCTTLDGAASMSDIQFSAIAVSSIN